MQKEQKKNKRGRPSPYKKEFNDLAYKYCLLGATDKRLAEFFEIDEATINRWKVKYPKFCEALKDGRERADAEVADSLFQKAKGYSHKDTYISHYQGEVIKEEYIKHYPPDTAACFIWLKNRQSDLWKDHKEGEIVGDISEYFKAIANAINKSDTNSS